MSNEGVIVSVMFVSDGRALCTAEVERITKLSETVLAESFIDRDHLPFHLEDCQIAAFLIDMMNSYSSFVHGVAPQKLVLQKSLATLEDLWSRLGQARTM